MMDHQRCIAISSDILLAMLDNLQSADVSVGESSNKTAILPRPLPLIIPQNDASSLPFLILIIGEKIEISVCSKALRCCVLQKKKSIYSYFNKEKA